MVAVVLEDVEKELVLRGDPRDFVPKPFGWPVSKSGRQHYPVLFSTFQLHPFEMVIVYPVSKLCLILMFVIWN